MEAHPDSGSPLEPFIPSQAVSTAGKRTRLHQTQSLFISGSGATKKRSGTPARVRLTALWNRMAWKPANRNYPFPRPARIRRRPTGRKHKPPQRKERSSPFSAVPPLPCAADCPQAAAPSFFPGGLSFGMQVGPHHHGIRERLRLHHGNVQRHVLHDFFFNDIR